MIIFPTGIKLTANENSCLLHIVADSEAWISSAIAEKAKVRQDALIKEWRSRLYDDESVTELPANPDDLATLILDREDYKTRAQQDEEPIITHARDKYDAVTRSGSIITLFPSGITIADLSANCILAYVQNLEEWVMGAVMGRINRGKKQMIAKYHPIIMDDPDVTITPATEEGLISMIVARDDYKRLA